MDSEISSTPPLLTDAGLENVINAAMPNGTFPIELQNVFKCITSFSFYTNYSYF